MVAVFFGDRMICGQSLSVVFFCKFWKQSFWTLADFHIFLDGSIRWTMKNIRLARKASVLYLVLNDRFGPTK